MGVIDRIRNVLDPPARSMTSLVGPGSAWNDWNSFSFNGVSYPLGLNQTLPGERQEVINEDFQSLVAYGYRNNGVVFACMLARFMLFSQARFQFQRIKAGTPGDFFGNPSLGILEHPWAGGTTGDLLTKMITHADLAGNAYVARRKGMLKVMRPDWVSIVLGSESNADTTAVDLDATVLGYIYYPGGRHTGDRDPIPLMRTEVAHFAPVPDPLALYRGMSWLTPIIREIMGDSAASTHKLRFWEQGATPNLVVKRSDNVTAPDFKAWVDMMEAGHAGLANAYKTLYLTSGADATVVGKDLQQMDFKVVQGAGETRIAAASGIHPVIIGLSEGMQGSSLNAGNFDSARRLTADRTLMPLWGNIAGSLETIVPAPDSSSRLWWDGRDIGFLREDRKNAADIQQVKAVSIRTLVDAGYTADSVVKAVEAEDMDLLIHSGLFSVQLQAPGSTKMPLGEAPGDIPVGGDGGTAPQETTPVKPTAPPPNGTKPKAGVPA